MKKLLRFNINILFNMCLFIVATFGVHKTYAVDCPANAQAIDVVLDADTVTRQDVPKGMFGFDAPWYEIQLGYFRKGEVREQIVQWMKPFQGTIYRYHGGNIFEWSKMIGPTEKRKSTYAGYAGEVFPEFGPLEFLNYLEKVDSYAVIVLNLSGPQDKTLSSADMVADNIALMRHVYSYYTSQQKEPRILYWELGNELDWKPFNWSAQKYIERAKPLLTEAKKIFPQAKFIANGRTDPWRVGEKDAGAFNAAIASALPVDAVSIHPYYDGLPIPAMTKAINEFAQTFQKVNPAAQVMVTEHGRWPSVPKTGRWEDKWYLASGSLGAISASDFVLSQVENKNVGFTAWHALGVRGPWQLFRQNKKSDEVYPSVTYWGLRTLREGMLKDAIKVTPKYFGGGDYAGGYGRHFVAMKNDSNELSLLGVNRVDQPVNLRMRLKGGQDWKLTEGYITKIDIKGEDNSEQAPNKYQMEKSALPSTVGVERHYCVPAASIFAVKGRL